MVESGDVITFRATDNALRIINDTMTARNIDTRSEAIIYLIESASSQVPSESKGSDISPPISTDAQHRINQQLRAKLQTLPLNEYNALLDEAIRIVRLLDQQREETMLHDTQQKGSVVERSNLH